MAKVAATHKVKDFDNWHPYYKEDEERRSKAGIKTISVNRGKMDPHHVLMYWEVDDPSVIKEMSKDPDLKEKMEKAGVVSSLEYFVLD